MRTGEVSPTRSNGMSLFFTGVCETRSSRWPKVDGCQVKHLCRVGVQVSKVKKNAVTLPVVIGVSSCHSLICPIVQW